MSAVPRSAAELCARLDERMEHAERALDRLPHCYVTQVAFRPVQLIAFGLVALAGAMLLGAVINLVIRGAP